MQESIKIESTLSLASETLSAETQEKKPPLYHFFYTLNIVMVLGIAFCNTLGLSAVKYFFYTEFFVVCASAYVLPFQHFLPILMYYFFLEGQGRILSNHNAIFRLGTDVPIFFAIIRSFIYNRCLLPKKIIHPFIMVMIAGHMLWFIVELFNFKSLSVVEEFISAKFFIYPYLIFFTFLANPLNYNSSYFKKMVNAIIYMSFLQIILAHIQMKGGEDFLTNLGPSYQASGELRAFQGSQFRPFGTTFGAGGFASYLYLTASFLFLVKPRRKILRQSLNYLVWIGSWYALFLSQVRSAMIKHIFLLACSSLLIFVGGTFRLRKLVFSSLALSLILLPSIFSYDKLLNAVSDLDLDKSTERFMSLADKKTLTTSRMTPEVFYRYLTKRLAQDPLGIGAARVTSAKLFSNDDGVKDPILTDNYAWAGDNLFVTVIFAYGYGAIFYFAVIFSIPLYLLAKTIKAYRSRNENAFKPLAISFLVTSIILVFQWGAVGIITNPECLCFWLWAAVGIHTKNNFLEKMPPELEQYYKSRDLKK